MIAPMALLLLLFATTTGAGGIVLMKKGTLQLDKLRLQTLLRNTPLIAGIALFGVSTLFFIASLHYGELPLLYTLTGATYVWLLLLSHHYLDEPITTSKLIGVALIICGIALISI